jgi:phenylpropionate dioxygenase-like ring-hydroxylating dioxygenase large terminal subunit
MSQIARFSVQNGFAAANGYTTIPSPTLAPENHMSETAPPATQPDSLPQSPAPATTGMLFGFWYPAARTPDVRAGAIRGVTLLELPLAIGRDAQGRPFALADLCPHRAMPLSFGRVDGDTVECCYHGWKFAAQGGQCRAIPSLTEGANVKIDRIFARSYQCAERDGYIWVYLPDPDTESFQVEIPPVPELPVFSERYRSTHVSVEFPSDVDQGVLGLLDPAHGPYVHQSWYWRSSHNLRDKQKTFEPIPNGFRMVPHAPSANSAAYKLLGVYGQPVTTTIDFVLPNQRTETVRCGKLWFTNRTVVTPIRRDLCRLDFCAAWNLFRGVPLVTSIFNLFARRFIAQDQRNMDRQTVGLRQNPPAGPPMMLVGDADRQARWYFDLKAAVLRARRTGEPMEHPLSGPVTLRWRT